MPKYDIKKSTTDVTTYVFIQDSSSTTGAGRTGLAYNTASLVAYYVRPLGNATQITLATQTVTGAHSDGGFVEVDSTNMPGVYRFDLPDAVCATGVNSVVVMLKGASNMPPTPMEIQLLAYDPQDATSLGISRIDAAITSRLASASYTAPDNTTITNIYTVVDTEVGAIKAKTDQLTFSTANRVDSQIFGLEANVITATSIASDAITAAKIAADAITAAKIATGAIDADALAADAANEIADALLDRTNGVETSYTLRQSLRLILSATAAKLSGAATTTVTIRDVGDSKDRITATVDADGNRTAVTLDAT